MSGSALKKLAAEVISVNTELNLEKPKLLTALEKPVFDRFRTIGFTDIDEDMLPYLYDLNPLIHPRLQRYIGTGNYQIFVIAYSGYAIIDMGGENGYTAEKNEQEYCEFKDSTFTIDELYKQIQRDSWTEVIDSTEFENGAILSVQSHSPDEENKDDTV